MGENFLSLLLRFRRDAILDFASQDAFENALLQVHTLYHTRTEGNMKMTKEIPHEIPRI